jgi:hypothetical protein
MSNPLASLRTLRKVNQRRFIRYLRWLKFCEYFQTPAPVAFSLRATVLMFVILAIMPFHPMAIPTAIGAGISLSLMYTGLGRMTL